MWPTISPMLASVFGKQWCNAALTWIHKLMNTVITCTRCQLSNPLQVFYCGELYVGRATDSCHRARPDEWMNTERSATLVAKTDQGVRGGVSCSSRPPTGALLSSAWRNGDWCWTCTQGRTLEANINQLSDLVSPYPQEYRAPASMVTAHREKTDCS